MKEERSTFYFLYILAAISAWANVLFFFAPQGTGFFAGNGVGVASAVWFLIYSPIIFLFWLLAFLKNKSAIWTVFIAAGLAAPLVMIVFGPVNFFVE